ncbi:hypothetical protein [Streptomyces sp. NPDC056883]|uniref:hypothetical protein n=1 Tax=Streptomyces sp. NPDC056883 TaxID=3345959 RepID=UPI0036C206EB
MHDDNEFSEPDETEGQGAEDSEAQADAVPPPDEWIREAAVVFGALAADAARTREALRQAISPLIPVIADIQRYGQTIRDNMPDLSFLSSIAPQIDPEWFRGLADVLVTAHGIIRKTLPSNWLGESFDYTVMVSVLNEGIPLAWVPSAPVIHGLLAAPDARARLRVLEANTEEIVAACRKALSEVSQPGLQQQVALLEDCLAMVEADLPAGAQALAASVWDTVYRAVWRADPLLKTPGWFKYKEVTRKLPKADLDDSTLLAFRHACVLAPIVKGLEEFRDGHPIPSAFNRHATTHAAGASQYTTANALTVLMLAVSLVRELEQGNLAFAIHS